MTKRKPHEIDQNKINKYVGEMIRLGRLNKDKMPQTTLAKPLGISYQQLQKIERGENRVSAGRLYVIAGILEMNMKDFFPERDDVKGINIPDIIKGKKLADVAMRDLGKVIEEYNALKGDE